MKRLVICCDGTWRRLDEAEPTNVTRLACMTPARAPDGAVQIVAHLDGVGTGRGSTRLARGLDRYAGGALGAGLDASVVEAYRLLVFNYEPGDEIYLFGYSRGAFTARSLAGMIRKCGILSRAHARRIGEALDLYRDRDPAKGPKEPPSRAFRAAYSPDVAIGEDDIAWRRAQFPERDLSRVHKLRIRYIGVWDTVGALGVPGFVLASPLFNRRHQFHDAALSSHVAAARHAVAVDERRRTFEPTLWDNLPDLNAGARGPDAPYQQRWFPGAHGAVGGGGKDRSLSNLALIWVLQGAERQGLAVDPAERKKFLAGDPLGPLHPTPSASARVTALLGKDRAGPEAGEADALSEPVRTRWHRDPTYRPRTLARVRALLDADPPPLAEPSAAAEQGVRLQNGISSSSAL